MVGLHSTLNPHLGSLALTCPQVFAILVQRPVREALALNWPCRFRKLRSSFHDAARAARCIGAKSVAICWRGLYLHGVDIAEGGSKFMSPYFIKDPKHWLDHATQAHAI